MDMTNQIENFSRKRGKKEARIRNEASKQLQHQSIVYAKKGSLKYAPYFDKLGYPWIELDFPIRLSKGAKDTRKEEPHLSFAAKQHYVQKGKPETSIHVELPKVAPPSRERTDSRIMLRRPTTMVPEPVLETEDSFQSLANSVELRSIMIDQSPAKTYEFYRTHFPLLLEKSVIEDREKIFHKRNFVRETPEQLAKRRSKEMSEKLDELHTQIQDLENEMTDGKFRTELRNKMFDPRIWPWNKERYSQPVNFYDN